MSDIDNTRVGTISMWASISGIVVPIIIALLVRVFVRADHGTYHILCVFLFVGCELVAFVTGLIGRRSVSGKAGLSISIICIVLTLLFATVFGRLPQRGGRGSSERPETSQPQIAP
jgi:hypothetical protein